MGSFWTDVYYTVYRACLWGVALLPIMMMLVNFWLWRSILTDEGRRYSSSIRRHFFAYAHQLSFVYGLIVLCSLVVGIQVYMGLTPMQEMLRYPYDLYMAVMKLISYLLAAPWGLRFWVNLWNGSLLDFYLAYRNTMLDELLTGDNVPLALLSYSALWMGVGLALTLYAGLIQALAGFLWRWPNRHRLVKPHF